MLQNVSAINVCLGFTWDDQKMAEKSPPFFFSHSDTLFVQYAVVVLEMFVVLPCFVPILANFSRPARLQV